MSVVKPVVHYLADPVIKAVKIGASAFVWTLDHPNTWCVSNRQLVVTSPVISKAENGVDFETRNSVYICVGTKEKE